MAKKSPKKFSWKRVALLVGVALTLASAVGGAKYWWDGHPHYKPEECLETEGLYIKILDNKGGTYKVLVQLKAFPVVIPMEVPIRELNREKARQIDCKTGEPLK